jgi:hypothetical protein
LHYIRDLTLARLLEVNDASILLTPFTRLLGIIIFNAWVSSRSGGLFNDIFGTLKHNEATVLIFAMNSEVKQGRTAARTLQ